MILIAGGTGRLGREVVTEMKRRGRRIRVLTRRPEHVPFAVDDIVGGDLLDPASLRRACDGVDHIFSAAGASIDLRFSWRAARFSDVDYTGTLNLLNAARAAGVKKFVYVSVFSPPPLNQTAYVRAHHNAAEALRRSGLDYAVIQPTGFFSAFAVLLDIARRGRAPLIGDGTARTNPIHERDLALVCADAIEHGSGEIAAGGPDVLSRRAIFELAFEAVGKKPRFVRVPGSLLAVNGWILSPLDPRLSELVAFFAAVSQTDIVAPMHGSRRLDAYFKDSVARIKPDTASM